MPDCQKPHEDPVKDGALLEDRSVFRIKTSRGTTTRIAEASISVTVLDGPGYATGDMATMLRHSTLNRLPVARKKATTGRK